MTCIGNEPRLTKDNPHKKSVTNRQRSVAWILAAFVFLIVGVVGGALVFAWRREWAWILPVVSFGGYLLAFRCGLLQWNPAIETTWRRYLWLDSEMIAEDEEIPDLVEDPGMTLRIVRPETRRPQHELRVVR